MYVYKKNNEARFACARVNNNNNTGENCAICLHTKRQRVSLLESADILSKLVHIYLKVEFKRLLTDGNENDDDDANGRLEEWERGGGAIFGTERTADVVVVVVVVVAARSFLLPGTSATKAIDIFLYNAFFFFFFFLFFFFSRDGGRMDAPGER